MATSVDAYAAKHWLVLDGKNIPNVSRAGTPETNDETSEPIHVNNVDIAKNMLPAITVNNATLAAFLVKNDSTILTVTVDINVPNAGNPINAGIGIMLSPYMCS